MAECQVHPSNPWAGDCSRYGLAPDLTSSRVPRIRRSPVIVGLVPSLVDRKGLRELVAIVALFGNYGLTLERALDRAVLVYTTIATSKRKSVAGSMQRRRSHHQCPCNNSNRNGNVI